MIDSLSLDGVMEASPRRAKPFVNWDYKFRVGIEGLWGALRFDHRMLSMFQKADSTVHGRYGG